MSFAREAFSVLLILLRSWLEQFVVVSRLSNCFRRLDDRIQWLTEYKDYKTQADPLKTTLEDYQTKLESCEKPTSNKAERDKQATFLNVSVLILF